ncbi:hypothetical protein niasHS_008864 [Heterodera schachtii]|uniref:MATH domain-containing protein n=1 Tax=Heterodera schachtii TaxID=97005 RepID=A0ABD2IVP2_HETSC
MSFSCNSTIDEFTTDQGTFENVTPPADEELQCLSTEMECEQNMPSQNENVVSDNVHKNEMTKSDYLAKFFKRLSRIENSTDAHLSADGQGNSKKKMINTQPSENRRAMLGPALFSIRFPLISKEEFSTKIFPLGVLTSDEVISIYQFHCHSNDYYGNTNSMPAVVPMPFSTHGRISDRKKRTLVLNIGKLSDFALEPDGSRRHSEVMYIMALPWKILAQTITKNGNNENFLYFSLCCIDPNKDSNWFCRCSATFRIMSENIGTAHFIATFNDIVINTIRNTFPLHLPFAMFRELLNDKLTLAIDVTLKEAEAMDKISSVPDQNNSFGTISMEIEKISEFSRENLYSNHTSETVHLKGFPWQIMAPINPNMDGTNGTEKYLGFYLWCTTLKRENWSCKCSSATLRIVSQFGADWDFRREIRDTVFNNFLTNSGFPNFIAFSELMDPTKGLYNPKEDNAHAYPKLQIHFSQSASANHSLTALQIHFSQSASANHSNNNSSIY